MASSHAVGRRMRALERERASPSPRHKGPKRSSQKMLADHGIVRQEDEVAFLNGEALRVARETGRAAERSTI